MLNYEGLQTAQPRAAGDAYFVKVDADTTTENSTRRGALRETDSSESEGDLFRYTVADNLG